MSRVDAAAADRLPWLPDEPKPQPVQRRGRTLIGWIAAVVLPVLAVAAFWIATRSVQDHEPIATRQIAPSATVRLPEPRAVEPEVRIQTQPEIKSGPTPQVLPAPVREVRIIPPARMIAQKRDAVVAEPAKSDEFVATPALPSPHPFVPPKPWNPRIFAGAAGRVVQIGAFGSIHQSKRGWWYMVRAYPAMRNLPAIVRPARNSKGRFFYRFQVGTTSQAHSEILCQRMEKIGLSCAVVGLPWKVKVER